MANEIYGKTIASTYEKLLFTVSDTGLSSSSTYIATNADGSATKNLSALSLSTSKVGIGTDSPDRKLDVETSDSVIADFDGTGSCGFIDIRNDARTARVGIFQNDVFGIDADGGSVDKGHLNIDADGNVGIGTDTPARSLCVQSSSSSYGMARFTRDSTTHGEATIGFEHSSDASDPETWVVGTGGWSNPNDFVIGQNGVMFLIETSTGDIGIGTTDPGGKLHALSSTSDENGIVSEMTSSSYTNSAIYGNVTSSSSGSSNILRLRSAGTDRMVVLDNGNVGIGITAPAVNLAITATRPKLSLATSDGTDKGMRLEYNESDDELRFQSCDEDGTYDSSPGTLMVIERDTGNVGIGTTSPAARLHVENVVGEGSEASAHIRITGSATSNYSAHHWIDATAYYIGHNGGTRDLRMYNEVESAGVALETSGDTSWGTFSDERAKTDITDIGSTLDKFKDVRCVNFRYNSDPSDRRIRIGVIAQDLVGKFDEVLNLGDGWGDLIEDDNQYYSVKYTELIPSLIKAIQELSAKVTALENK